MAEAARFQNCGYACNKIFRVQIFVLIRLLFQLLFLSITFVRGFNCAAHHSAATKWSSIKQYGIILLCAERGSLCSGVLLLGSYREIESVQNWQKYEVFWLFGDGHFWLYSLWSQSGAERSMTYQMKHIIYSNVDCSKVNVFICNLILFSITRQKQLGTSFFTSLKIDKRGCATYATLWYMFLDKYTNKLSKNNIHNHDKIDFYH